MYLLTHSLLSSWLYALESEYESADRNAMDEFLTVLRREPTPTTEAMQKGIDFEDLVTAVAGGAEPKNHPWYVPAAKVAGIVRGGIFQYAAKCEAEIADEHLLLYGRLDALKGGSIYDIKFTSRYDVGKFYGSTQHPMYMFIVPEAQDFTYLVSNGKDVWQETYRRDEVGDIRVVAEHFIHWLKENGLMQVYRTCWKAK